MKSLLISIALLLTLTTPGCANLPTNASPASLCVKAGGPQKAYIETVNVTIADGKLDITFESGVDNPEINGIEIIPAP